MEGFVWREVDRYVVALSDCCHWKLIRKENEAFSSNWDEWLRWSSYCLDPSAFRAHLEPAWRPSQTFLIKEQRQEDQLKQVKPFKVATNRIRTCSKFNFTQNKTNYSKTFLISLKVSAIGFRSDQIECDVHAVKRPKSRLSRIGSEREIASSWLGSLIRSSLGWIEGFSGRAVTADMLLGQSEWADWSLLENALRLFPVSSANQCFNKKCFLSSTFHKSSKLLSAVYFSILLNLYMFILSCVVVEDVMIIRYYCPTSFIYSVPGNKEISQWNSLSALHFCHLEYLACDKTQQ